MPIVIINELAIFLETGAGTKWRDITFCSIWFDLISIVITVLYVSSKISAKFSKSVFQTSSTFKSYITPVGEYINSLSLWRENGWYLLVTGKTFSIPSSTVSVPLLESISAIATAKSSWHSVYHFCCITLNKISGILS